ncbi:helicase-related protein [Saccharopolyspora sp. NPDC050389]|uniref:helicase-related protein n=1 Tax=Saccharopolyspora sp. NPDC050389 TaxID=3155516 RepID=UPI00340F5513
MSEHDEHYRFRGELLKGLKQDLLGPARSENEVLTDPPVTTYATGILFPRREEQDEKGHKRSRQSNDEADIDLASVRLSSDEVPDTGVAMANVQAPSSMGMTFAVDPSTSQKVMLTFEVAVYEPVDEAGNPVEAKHAERRSTEDQGIRWRRRPLYPASVQIDLDNPPNGKQKLLDGLELRLRVREPRDGTVSITATLVNVNRIATSDLQDPHCFFQPLIKANGALVERPGPGGGSDPEVVASRLLHRYAPTFAVGHGCSVEWDWNPPSPDDLIERADCPATVPEVRTTYVPSHEMLLTDSNPEIETGALGMQNLATASDEELFNALDSLVDGYRVWISQRRDEAEHLRGNEFLKTIEAHLENCVRAQERIESGIRLLRKNRDALRAFRLANEAMALQRGRSSWIKNKRRGPVALDGKWRPFQIAFVLQCLDGIADPDHPDRGYVDLLWFPTGGGKTEAYLGLIAFTVFLRRIRKGSSGGGVTAIMRYTLRLLTLQQFERAASLICAMELIRRKSGANLGPEISLGMWVGKDATPNDLKRAEASLDLLRKGDKVQTEDPVQLRVCPWCGTAMDARNYRVESSEMTIFCGASQCDFRSGLPVHVVDEMIYRVRPTLIIATSDKFARIPWRADVAALFNRDVDGIPPPELIVQDELHLISGPLGSLAGLYETVVDEAADRPKIVASTATIRRATKQGRSLFDREVAQFPPPGLDARDSWFAVETSRRDKATRLYVGLITPNTSQATLLVRTYAALLHHAAHIEGVDTVRDAYWTLVGYFNSLRLLAAADLQVRDDVRDRLSLLAGGDDGKARAAEIVAELTSRIDSSDIPTYLEDLARALPEKAVLDVLLATNMISVGVDVDRLGLMAIMGQPQTTAEYIQSSSRVGRQHPGMVVTMYNAARSRDRSHYENFLSYHSALYRQVESTSVTPFSSRARDRALHAVLVGMARLMIDEARPNKAAADIESFRPRLDELVKLILARVDNVAKEECEGTRAQLESIIDDWSQLAASNPNLVYEPRPKRAGPRGSAASLLCMFTDNDLDEAYPTLWSLRDVDEESDFYLER